MNTSSRREFFTYAAGATLVSAIPALAQTKTDETKNDTATAGLPLVVDAIGPMALKWSGTDFELWMPDIDKYPHQAGITTTVTSIVLDKGDYEMIGPSATLAKPKTYALADAKIYQTKVKNTSAPKYYIKMSLPMPRCIVALHPIAATISDAATKSQGKFAVGVRLLYDKAGGPTLKSPDGSSRSIEFYAAPCETQTNMQIGYLSSNVINDENEAKYSFGQISQLFGLGLQVAFDPQVIKAMTKGQRRPCMSPVIGLA